MKPEIESKYNISELKEEYKEDTLPFLNLLMALMWLARNYRYDILLACIFFSQFSKCYNQEVFDDLLNVLLYVMNRKTYRLTFTSSLLDKTQPLKIRCFVDSSFKETSIV